GCEPEPNDPRDLLGAKMLSPIIPEKRIDWRELGYLTKVKNQLNTNCCTGEGSIGAFESLKIIKKNEKLDFSELFTYWNARNFEGATQYDGGAFIRDALKSLNQNGACFEAYWNFDVNNVMKKPSWIAYFGARFNKISKYYKLYSLTEIQQCLSQKIPVVAGINVYESIEDARKGGEISMPKSNEKQIGGHCIQLAGYDDKQKEMIIKNSWGEDFGDKGFLYAPYDFMDKFSFDWWAIE
ncbi:MAG: C1 family peptidase, partial [Candidatus Woesearchaeota archaeon]|nr:C1 family peptidase [Candidatus Woesearchaeota archaeon]